MHLGGRCRPSTVRLNSNIRRPYLPIPGKRCALRDFELARVRIPPPRLSVMGLGPRVQNAPPGPKCLSGAPTPRYRDLNP